MLTRIRLGRLCRSLVRRYGRPDWYTKGQLETTAQLLGERAALSVALCLLTENAGVARDEARKRFADRFPHGATRFSAKDVVRKLAPLPFRGDGNWPSRIVYLGGPQF